MILTNLKRLEAMRTRFFSGRNSLFMGGIIGRLLLGVKKKCSHYFVGLSHNMME
jgi:hypothetical protein